MAITTLRNLLSDLETEINNCLWTDLLDDQNILNQYEINSALRKLKEVVQSVDTIETELDNLDDVEDRLIAIRKNIYKQL